MTTGSGSLRKIGRDLERIGPISTILKILYRALGFVADLEVLQAVRLRQADINFDKIDFPNTLSLVRMDEVQCMAHTTDAIYDMSAEFVRERYASGGECWGYYDDDILVCYNWIATQSPLKDVDHTIGFGEGWLYSNKGYTLRDYRGQRLFSLIQIATMKALSPSPWRGMIGLIDAVNYNSKKSNTFAGYEEFGKVLIFRLFGKSFAFHSPGCRTLGLHIEPRSSVPQK